MAFVCICDGYLSSAVLESFEDFLGSDVAIVAEYIGVVHEGQDFVGYLDVGQDHGCGILR